MGGIPVPLGICAAQQVDNQPILDHRRLPMTSLKNFSFVLALAIGASAAGCAADAPDMGDDGGGGGGGGGGGDDAPVPTDATGRYQMTSTFDIASGMPGKVGEVTNAFIAATDGGDDPANWILEQIINKMSSGTLKTFLNGARPFVAGYLNDRLLDIAPDFVTTFVQIGNDFGQAAKNFGLDETLEVTGATGAYSSTVSAVGVKFKIDNIESDILFADNSIAAVSAAGVGITLDATGKLDIAEHKLPLSYGKVLKLGLDKVIIPAVDASATNLQTLLTHLVDCAAVGQAINDALVDQIGFGGGAGTWQTACTAGLAFGASALYGKIDSIDTSALEFGLTGTAKAVDTNADHKIDRIQTGAWSGTLSYSGTPAPLAGATFTGTRM
jgi:hypothetical protein